MPKQAEKATKSSKKAGKHEASEVKADKEGGGGKQSAQKALHAVAPVTPTRPERWKQEPDEHDYPAARDYLSLLLADSAAEHAVQVIQRSSIVVRKAKDLLRASRLPLLSADNPAVSQDLSKVAAGERLSPVLALRGRLGTNVPLTIADGYHRICASYHLDEDADIPCRLGDIARR
jgi:hypothetical protein